MSIVGEPAQALTDHTAPAALLRCVGVLALVNLVDKMLAMLMHRVIAECIKHRESHGRQGERICSLTVPQVDGTMKSFVVRV
jgi:hypothetical protein